MYTNVMSSEDDFIMQLASARQANVHLEEENMAAQGKKQVMNTPRRALGDMKNKATPGRSALKTTASVQKPTLKIVDPNTECSATQGRGSQKYSTFHHPLAPLNFDVSEEEYVEQCNLQEDRSFAEKLHQQNSIVLENPENEAEYWDKLVSAGDLSTVAEDDDTVEMCGPEEEPEDYDDILNPPGGSTVLREEGPNFTYERLDDEDMDDVRRYTLEEMEEMFETFGEILLV